MGITTINVMGDMVGTIIVSYSEKKHLAKTLDKPVAEY
jgi:Na+/H+-dicarboxylate symporter